jgi:solute carrier family 35 protein E1
MDSQPHTYIEVIASDQTIPVKDGESKEASSTTSLSLWSSFKRISEVTMVTQKVFKLLFYYFLLYFFTVVYNVANKKVLESFPLPISISAIQLFLGIPLFLPIWTIKPPRNLFQIDKKSYSIISLCHGLGNLATTYALNSGSVSFTHVVKSGEPLFTALLSLVINRSRLSVASYLTLIPIVVGVALASMKELSFSWFGFSAAMASNFLYQLRMVLSKSVFNEKDIKMSAADTFRVITIISFLQMLPLALIFERNDLFFYLKEFQTNLSHRNFVMFNLLVSGFSFYIYNEVSFWILDLVHPVTHAVGNTIKRVVLVIASIFIFKIPVNGIGLLGSAIAILGSLLYAVSQEQRKEVTTHVNSNVSKSNESRV